MYYHLDLESISYCVIFIDFRGNGLVVIYNNQQLIEFMNQFLMDVQTKILFQENCRKCNSTFFEKVVAKLLRGDF